METIYDNPESNEFNANKNTAFNLDLSYLKGILDNSREALVEVLFTIQEELPLQLQDLRISSKAQSWKQVGRDAHKMKSTILMIGARDLVYLLEETEKIANTETEALRLPSLVEQVIYLGNLALAKVKEELEMLS